MSGYIGMTMSLIQDIEKVKGAVDFQLFQDRFFAIEKEVLKIKDFDKHFSDAIKLKIDGITAAEQNKKARILIAYLNMVERLGKSKDAMVSCGIICIMIPVICTFLREQQ